MKPYQEKLGIKYWAEADRPREKLMLKGRRQLTDAELIAILISSGNKDETAVDLSRRILASYNNDLDVLGKVTVKELSKFKGIGEAKAIAIVAALEIGRRRKETAEKEVVKITTSAQAYNVLLPVFADLNHEEFWILMLNQANYVIGKQPISSGGLAGTVADPKVIFKMALEHNATYVILAHNHPSGSLTPSEQDIQVTKKLVSGGILLDLYVIDHLIVTNKLYYSFGDEGLI